MYSYGPSIGEIAADNYVVTDDYWQTQASSANINNQTFALNYIWSEKALPDNNSSWIAPYQQPVYYSNLILDQLKVISIAPNEIAQANILKGEALFYRAYVFQQLADLYGKPYSASASTDLSIVLRLTSDINAVSTRATVKETYDQIIGDLKEAINLLPSSTPFPTIPTKTAAYAELARTYLAMSDYVNAGFYANLSLQSYNTLIDYNNLVPVGNPVIKTFNQEIIFHSTSPTPNALVSGIGLIEPSLYQSYSNNDLRKMVFFIANTGALAGTYSFQGSYHGTNSGYTPFLGLTTAEMLLIRAECFARAGNTASALMDLNTLMIKRFKTGTFTPFNAVDANDALDKVLIERRKELVFRGLRWSDIRRLNLAGANITLTRKVAGQTYTLPPNDPRSVLPIPYDVVNKSGIPQNPR